MLTAENFTCGPATWRSNAAWCLNATWAPFGPRSTALNCNTADNTRCCPKSIQGAPTWWDACVFGPADRIRFVLQTKPAGAVVGEATFWDMGPLSTRWQTHAMGMISFRILQAQRGQGLGEFLLAEALRQLADGGVARVQAQTRNGTKVPRGAAEAGLQPGGRRRRVRKRRGGRRASKKPEPRGWRGQSSDAPAHASRGICFCPGHQLGSVRTSCRHPWCGPSNLRIIP